MATKDTKVLINQDFSAMTEADLDVQMSAFKATWTAEHGARLAIDGKRSLGPGKVRVTFRIVAEPSGKGAKKR